MDETSILQTVEDAVLNQREHGGLCSLPTDPQTRVVTIARGSECFNHFDLIFYEVLS